MYEIEFDSRARRALSSRLPESVAAAAFAFIYGPLAENPHRVGKALGDDRQGQYSARRGEYRIIYRIVESTVLVVVIDIDHRRDVYHR